MRVRVEAKHTCWAACQRADALGGKEREPPGVNTHFLHSKLFLFRELVAVSNLSLFHNDVPRPSYKLVLPEAGSHAPARTQHPRGDAPTPAVSLYLDEFATIQ